jgi:hypothetical protein
MIGGEFEKGVDLSRRMGIPSIAVIPPKWTNIRNSHIPSNKLVWTPIMKEKDKKNLLDNKSEKFKMTEI